MTHQIRPDALEAFLADPARPAGTLSYHELQGFLFTLASSPELVPPSEWMPMVFDEQEAGYATLEEAQTVIGELMALYNAVNAAVAEEPVAQPVDCVFRDDILTNLDDAAPIAQWSRGFLRGHQWLELFQVRPCPIGLPGVRFRHASHLRVPSPPIAITAC